MLRFEQCSKLGELPIDIMAEVIRDDFFVAHERLFRQITDTWVRPIEDDPLNDCGQHASHEETKDVLDGVCLDRPESV